MRKFFERGKAISQRFTNLYNKTNTSLKTITIYVSESGAKNEVPCLFAVEAFNINFGLVKSLPVKASQKNCLIMMYI